MTEREHILPEPEVQTDFDEVPPVDSIGHALLEAYSSYDDLAINDVLTAIYQQYYGLLMAVSMHHVQDWHYAEEAVNDVLKRLHRTMSNSGCGFNPEMGNLTAYLIGIAKKAAIDITRKKEWRAAYNLKRTQHLEDLHEQEGQPDNIDFAHDKELVERALFQLSPLHREVLELHFYEGLTVSEIAERLNKPLGTIKSRLRLGQQALYVLLTQEYAA